MKRNKTLHINEQNQLSKVETDPLTGDTLCSINIFDLFMLTERQTAPISTCLRSFLAACCLSPPLM